MSYEIDHLFICVSEGAPGADALIEFGLTEGSPNAHPSQGTANRRFFFRNAMLELLWVTDPEDANGDVARRTGLWQRWSGRNACSPFGVCFRPSSSMQSEPPFPAWRYCPPYLPDGLAIHVGLDTPLTEPMWFFLAFGRRPDFVESDQREPTEHQIKIAELTRVRIITPSLERVSPTTERVLETGLVTLSAGQQHLLELTFDRDQNGISADFRPDLPLILKW